MLATGLSRPPSEAAICTRDGDATGDGLVWLGVVVVGVVIVGAVVVGAVELGVVEVVVDAGTGTELLVAGTPIPSRLVAETVNS